MDAVIEVNGLSKVFRPPFKASKVVAVKRVDFSVKKGEVFGFLGPNGAGKTTTIKVLTGLIRPTSGTVRILGGSPRDLRVRQRIGYLPEQPYFYDYLKPTELLDIFGRLFGMERRERRKRIDELLELVGLSHARNRTLRKFSKGMLQRVGIAQAILNDPDLLILDEPMSGLDPIGRRDVADLIGRLKEQGKTIFFSSHILADIERLCDRVLILHKGECRATGTLQELLRPAEAEKEVVFRAEQVPETLSNLVGPDRVSELSSGTYKVVVSGKDSDVVLRTLVAARARIESVTDRRISLEELVMTLSQASE